VPGVRGGLREDPADGPGAHDGNPAHLGRPP
jgi:hypothetical protein